MPRYYFDTFNDFVVFDDEGLELPDLDAARTEVHTTLAALMRDERSGRRAVQYRADVRDEHSHVVLTATLLMVIDETAPSKRVAGGA